MNRIYHHLLNLLPIAILLALGLSPVCVSAGRISGRVLDGEGQGVPRAVVMLRDGEIGFPVDYRGHTSLLSQVLARGTSALQDLAYLVTDDSGGFEFESLRAGPYRILAQKWTESRFKGPWDVQGNRVRVYGLEEAVQVPDEGAARIRLRPFGAQSLGVDLARPDDDLYLLVSRSPPRCDPVLGYIAFGGDFLRNLLAFSRLPHGRITVEGLPEGMLYAGYLTQPAAAEFGAGMVQLPQKPGISRVRFGVPLPPLFGEGSTPSPRNAKLVRNFVQSLADEKYPEAHACLQRQLREQLGTNFLTMSWKSQEAQYGEFKDVIDIRSRSGPAGDDLWVTCRFSEATHTLCLTVSEHVNHSLLAEWREGNRPPPRTLRIVCMELDGLAREGFDLDAALSSQGVKNPPGLYSINGQIALAGQLDRRVTLPTVGQSRWPELLAAMKYCEMTSPREQ